MTKQPKLTVCSRDGMERTLTETQIQMDLGARAVRLPTLDEIDAQIFRIDPELFQRVPEDDPAFDAELTELLARGEAELFCGLRRDRWRRTSWWRSARRRAMRRR